MTTSARLCPWLAITTVSVIASGAVGPEIIVRVPHECDDEPQDDGAVQTRDRT